jgi:hypothetical protein
MFAAALVSLSCNVPQLMHNTDRTEKSNFPQRSPQHEHF